MALGVKTALAVLVLAVAAVIVYENPEYQQQIKDLLPNPSTNTATSAKAPSPPKAKTDATNNVESPSSSLSSDKGATKGSATESSAAKQSKEEPVIPRDAGVQRIELQPNSRVSPFRWKVIEQKGAKSIKDQIAAGKTRFVVKIGWETGGVFVKVHVGAASVCKINGRTSRRCRSGKIQVSRLEQVRIAIRRGDGTIDNYSILLVRSKIEAPGKKGLLMKKQSAYQTIRYHQNPGFKKKPSYAMSLNGVIQFSTLDLTSHEYMVRYPLMYAKKLERILIIGGGDGHAASELKRFMHLLQDTKIVNVELDDVLVDTTQNHPLLRRLSNDSYNHPNIEVIAGDGVAYLLNSPEKFDIIIDDCEFDVTGQDPEIKKLYDNYEQGLVDKLAPGGIGVIMEALDDFHTPPDEADDWSYARKMKWMKRVSKIEDESGDFRKKTPHVMSKLVWAYLVGPEEYIYWSNEPFKVRREVPKPSH